MKFVVAFIALALLGFGRPAKGVTGKTVSIDCGPGEHSSAGGTYGGASFSVSCQGNHSQQIMPSTTAWSVRVGVETHKVAYDCAYNGDSETVQVSCVNTIVTIE